MGDVATDLTGKVFGRLTVLYKGVTRKKKIAYWVCKCECGAVKEVSAGTLKHGNVRSCGCLTKDKRYDLTGKRFGMLVAITRTEYTVSGKKRSYWVCKCDCGNVKEIYTGHLNSGKMLSCGCMRKGPAGVELLGKRFGRLVVIKEYKSNGKGGSRWDVKCDCGNVINVVTGQLTSGGTVSCSCHKKELSAKRLSEYSRTHTGSLHHSIIQT